jgi:hypothetical protein
MKNILLGSIFVLSFLPQVCRADDAASIAFYQKQADDRAEYKKLHADEIAQQDKNSIAYYQKQADDRANYKKLHAAEIAQQDKNSIAFYQKQADDRGRARNHGNFNNSFTPPTPPDTGTPGNSAF